MKHENLFKRFRLTFVSTLLVHALAFVNSIFTSLFADFFKFVGNLVLSIELSLGALLGHDCFRRPDDDFDPSF